jgi:hypothetical protein
LEFLVGNSLGGFDTLACFGGLSFDLETSGETVQKNLTRDYQVRDGQSYKINVEGQQSITANTGWLNREQMQYLQEVLLSKDIYLVDDKTIVPVILNSKKLTYKNDDDRMKGYKLEFSRSNTERNYSNLKEFTPAVRYGNAFRSVLVAKNDCGSGSHGSTEVIRVQANTYYSTISQAEADQKAIDWLDENKQRLANEQGTCESAWQGQSTYRCQGSHDLIMEDGEPVEHGGNALNTGLVEQLYLNTDTEATEWRIGPDDGQAVDGTCPLPFIADFKQSILTTNADFAYIDWIYQLDPVPADLASVNFACQVNVNGVISNVDNRTSPQHFTLASDGTFKIRISNSIVYSFQRKVADYPVSVLLTAMSPDYIVVGVGQSDIQTVPHKL